MNPRVCLRATQQAHDPDALVRARTALELVDAAVSQTGEAHEHAAKRLADELGLWSERSAPRLRQSQSDRSAIEGL
ncbi:hypothetical protein ABIA31_006458 [Catenulispora sp. MAP5-51]|uniref:hypothetical protein n=1 Tax=Catenulispora sp. MAP5-51 TaxID=3156298 RepID=UPI0035164C1E